MENEHRKSKRTGMNVKIKLRTIQSEEITAASDEEIEVDVVNISKEGMGFKTQKVLAFNGLYDTVIVLSNGERFSSIIKIIRMENDGEPETVYGCHFVGINGADQFKIDVFQILCEYGRI